MKELYPYYLAANNVSIDTRTIDSDDLFFALSGPHFNANDYVQAALDKGASHVVCTDAAWQGHKKVTVVDDALISLQSLASYHRDQLTYPILALTGSNGKTTTKELILSVLSMGEKVKGTAGNFNNHIGVPLTLLSFPTDLDAGIVEMGANHQKEIAFLCNIARPDYGLITNYGKAHLEGFGGVEGVIKGKSEMYDYLRANNKTAIVGAWDTEQLRRTEGMNRLTTATTVNLLDSTPLLILDYKGQRVQSQLTGAYNYNNMCFAIRIGELFKLTTNQIVQGLASYHPTNNRSQIIKEQNTQIIMDAYNANPSSMRVALKNLSTLSFPKKVAVLGDMMEMGAYAAAEHQAIADYCQELALDELYLIGDHFAQTEHPTAHFFKDVHALKQETSWQLDDNQCILVKGSRSMTLEKLFGSMLF